MPIGYICEVDSQHFLVSIWVQQFYWYHWKPNRYQTTQVIPTLFKLINTNMSKAAILLKTPEKARFSRITVFKVSQKKVCLRNFG